MEYSDSHLSDPAKEFDSWLQCLVVFFVRCELDGFLAPDPEDSAEIQAVIEQVVHPVLERFFEIDHDVAAHDDVKLVEGAVGGQVVLGKDDVALERRTEDAAA